jgi:hypothetical protein
MPQSSLNNMTVPVGTNNQGLLMPKLRYRFRVFFENIGVSGTTTELSKQVISFARPNLSFEEIALPIYNSTMKLAGRHAWQDVTCEVRDDAGGNVSKLVGEQLQKQLDFVEMSSAASGIDYKFKTTFEVLDGGNGTAAPVVLESWELYGCYLKSVDYGAMNYGTNEAVTINMTIAYDNANQGQQGGGGVGPSALATSVGRTIAGTVSGLG